MSARAAWRLETLGFETYRYTAGKADWFANGLPIEGTEAGIPRIGDLARRDVPTCALTDRLGEVADRVRRAGWHECVVVNERNVVLGRLRDSAFAGDPTLPVEEAMDGGPTTYRPNLPAAETAQYLAEQKVASVLVTTSGGELIGVFRREDAAHLHAMHAK